MILALSDFWGNMALEYPFQWPERNGPVGSAVFKQWLQAVKHFTPEAIATATRRVIEDNADFIPKRQAFVELCRHGHLPGAREVAAELIAWQNSGEWHTELAFSVAQILNPSNVRAMSPREIQQLTPGAIKAAVKIGLRKIPEAMPRSRQLPKTKHRPTVKGRECIAQIRGRLKALARPAAKPMTKREGVCGRYTCNKPLPDNHPGSWCPDCEAGFGECEPGQQPSGKTA